MLVPKPEINFTEEERQRLFREFIHNYPQYNKWRAKYLLRLNAMDLTKLTYTCPACEWEVVVFPPNLDLQYAKDNATSCHDWKNSEHKNQYGVY